MPSFNDLIKCTLSQITVVSSTHIRLDLPKLNCTHMSGAIKLALLITPDAGKITVYVNGDLDVTYINKSNNWVSQRHFVQNKD